MQKHSLTYAHARTRTHAHTQSDIKQSNVISGRLSGLARHQNQTLIIVVPRETLMRRFRIDSHDWTHSTARETNIIGSRLAGLACTSLNRTDHMASIWHTLIRNTSHACGRARRVIYEIILPLTRCSYCISKHHTCTNMHVFCCCWL